jgi:hypothetical protein
MQAPEKDLNSKIRKFSSKLHVIVGFPAVFTAERAQEHFAEKGDVDE